MTMHKNSNDNNGIMQGAIVTGASTGIGRAIAELLCNKGYEVYGIGRDFAEKWWENKELAGTFHPVVCDLLDTKNMCEAIETISKTLEVHVLVNNAGTAYYGLHEELNATKISEMVRVNVEVPMILAQMLMRTLKKNKGYLINIASVTAQKSNPHGCAYGATKAALLSFSQSVFDENRKYGVKVATILPDMTKTELYRHADFTTDDDEMAYLCPDEVAGAVEYILNQREGVVPTQIVLQPQFHRIKKRVK